MLNNSAAFRRLHAGSVAWTLLIGAASVLVSTIDGRAQGMNMPGMKDTKGAAAKTGTGSGTITALNVANRKVTFDHGPMPEMNWPAMKMEFPVAPSVDLSKIKIGDKVRFTLTGSGNNYTVQSIAPSP